MDEEKLNEAVKKLKESKKRNFDQTIDLIINLKHLDLKNPDHQVEFYLQLPKPKGKQSKLCALVGPELADESKKEMDTTINVSDFNKYSKDKKTVKKLAEEHDFFVAQATIMTKVASAFGRVLGPKGKMPNPKAGGIVPPNANLKQVHEKFQNTVKISGKKAPLMQTIIGNEKSSDEDIKENFRYVYNNVLHHLPQRENNVKSVFLKTTMGKPIRVI